MKVMLVDDSAVVRGLIRKILEKQPDIQIVASVSDGEQALISYPKYRPDITIMDIEMPNMDGLTAVKELMKIDSEAKVIMCSSLTKSGAKATMDAIANGAVDCLTKPTSSSIDQGEDFASELVSKIRSICGQSSSDDIKLSQEAVRTYNPSQIKKILPKALLIGSSTGGPAALRELFSHIKEDLNVPVFITQHIPKGFSEHLAEIIQTKTNLTVSEAKEGMPVEAGHVYLAPGGMHMGVTKQAPHKIKLIDTEPVNFCKPSIDVMNESLIDAYGGSGLFIVLLTGMGADGLNTCKIMAESSNNFILAQDEASSVVWGIPGAVVNAGVADIVLPLSDIADYINKSF